MCPHPVHPQRRVHPAGHHQLQRRRVILHQPAQRISAGRTGQVKIINDQHPIRGVKVVSQRRNRIGRDLTIESHQLAGILADPWLAEPNSRGLDDGSHEPGRVSIGRIAAQPRRWPLRARCQPVRQQHGLARPRRAHHHPKANLFSPVQRVQQPRPAHQTRRQLRGTELRRREPGTSRLGLSLDCRVRHPASASCNATPTGGFAGTGPVPAMARFYRWQRSAQGLAGEGPRHPISGDDPKAAARAR